MLKAIDERLRLTLNYKVKADGTIGVHYSMMKSPEISEMLRVGLQCECTNRLSDVTYYGRGPWETIPTEKLLQWCLYITARCPLWDLTM